ncbi:hypothetical protein SDC9_156451 [bioreactor metagenome]|uniref:Uncharacterized protein n=1 Tax=bioreactor metagenome TaxID=1076179 RepID=A0A645F9M3_9ZZZZ
MFPSFLCGVNTREDHTGDDSRKNLADIKDHTGPHAVQKADSGCADYKGGPRVVAEGKHIFRFRLRAASLVV